MSSVDLPIQMPFPFKTTVPITCLTIPTRQRLIIPISPSVLLLTCSSAPLHTPFLNSDSEIFVPYVHWVTHTSNFLKLRYFNPPSTSRITCHWIPRLSLLLHPLRSKRTSTSAPLQFTGVPPASAAPLSSIQSCTNSASQSQKFTQRCHQNYNWTYFSTLFHLLLTI